MSDTPAVPATVTLSPVVTDFAHNAIIAAGAVIAAVAGSSPVGSIAVEISGILASVAGMLLSAVHVSALSWVGKALGAVTSVFNPTVAS